MTEETKNKIKYSISKLDRTGNNNQQSKKIYMFDKDGVLLKSFITINAAQLETGIQRETISASAYTDGNRITSGYRWAFKNKINPTIVRRNPIPENSLKNLDRCKKVKQIDITTKKEINRFDSCKDAIEYTGINQVASAASKRQKTAGGYIWEYV